MRQAAVTLYSYAELSDAAKAKARDWFRELQAQDSDWWADVYAEADAFAALLGIEIDRKAIPLRSGATRHDPAIWFSGFSSQGDGACFEGRYQYAPGGARKLRAEAPTDSKLAAIADGLQALQRANGYRLCAKVKHSGHYYHAGCTDIDVWKGDRVEEREASPEAERELIRLLRAFMDWIYRQLEAEDESRNEDDAIAENIEANGYEFTASGKIAPRELDAA